MVPRSVEILPSTTERDLLAAEPALRAPRVLADPTADSTNSRPLFPNATSPQLRLRATLGEDPVIEVGLD